MRALNVIYSIADPNRKSVELFESKLLKKTKTKQKNYCRAGLLCKTVSLSPNCKLGSIALSYSIMGKPRGLDPVQTIPVPVDL